MNANPVNFGDAKVDVCMSAYARGVTAAGGLPVHLPIDVDPLLIVERLDGLVLPGGADVEPSLYGAEPETDVYPPEPERDALELGLYRGAVDRRLPLLGICRGQQVVNVCAGGTLHQDVPPHSAFDKPAETEFHEVRFEPGSMLGEMYGPSARVNSLHHQAVDVVGAGLRVMEECCLLQPRFRPCGEALVVSSAAGGVDGVEVRFDEGSLVADAGLLLAGTLIARLGLEALIDEVVAPPEAGRGSGAEALSLVVSIPPPTKPPVDPG